MAFTLSVLDHMPDPATALEQLARITRRRLILVEPHPVREGTGRAVRAAGEDARDEPMPFTYLHDYDALLLGLGLVQELDLPMPTHLHRMGPLYRLRVLAPAPVTDLRRLVVQAGAVRLYGLPARTAARFEGAARQDPPRPCTSPPVPQASRRHSARRRRPTPSSCPAARPSACPKRRRAGG